MPRRIADLKRGQIVLADRLPEPILLRPHERSGRASRPTRSVREQYAVGLPEPVCEGGTRSVPCVGILTDLGEVDHCPSRDREEIC